MFSDKSNTLCNTPCLRQMTMEVMHKQMERLYQAAKEAAGITGQSALALALNMSPQTVNNWEARGISKQGMLAAQAKFGCSATWLDTGEGEMRLAGASAGGGLADSLKLTVETAAELRLLTIYRLADGHGKGAIDDVVDLVQINLNAAGNERKA